MAKSTKRKSSNRNVMDTEGGPDEVSSVNKRRCSSKIENESSTDSFSYSNDIPSDSEGSSDSEFEEHPYSRSASQMNQRLHNSRLKCKIDLGIGNSTWKTHFEGTRKSKCTSKNAIMARLNRLKKKQYIEGLEKKNAELEVENLKLKNMLEMRVKEVESLKRKALNLENVIRNSTEIGSLLKVVRQHTDLEISSSILKSTTENSCNTGVYVQSASSNDDHAVESFPTEEEAWVAAVLWGVALHTFCQP